MVEYIVAIDVTRVRFPADALFFGASILIPVPPRVQQVIHFLAAKRWRWEPNLQTVEVGAGPDLQTV